MFGRPILDLRRDEELAKDLAPPAAILSREIHHFRAQFRFNFRHRQLQCLVYPFCLSVGPGNYNLEAFLESAGMVVFIVSRQALNADRLWT